MNSNAIKRSLIEKRIRTVVQHVEEEQKIQQDYENERRFTSDPRRLGYIGEQIKRSQKTTDDYLEELMRLFGELEETASSKLERDQIQEQLTSIQVQLGLIDEHIGNVHGDLASRLESVSAKLILRIEEQNNSQDAETVKQLFRILEGQKKYIEEQNQILTQVIQALAKERAFVSNHETVQEAAEILSDPKVDTSHKLKVALPIIPLILSYEGEISLGTSVNLRALWNKLLSVANKSS